MVSTGLRIGLAEAKEKGEIPVVDGDKGGSTTLAEAVFKELGVVRVDHVYTPDEAGLILAGLNSRVFTPRSRHLLRTPGGVARGVEVGHLDHSSPSDKFIVGSTPEDHFRRQIVHTGWEIGAHVDPASTDSRGRGMYEELLLGEPGEEFILRSQPDLGPAAIAVLEGETEATFDIGDDDVRSTWLLPGSVLYVDLTRTGLKDETIPTGHSSTYVAGQHPANPSF